MVGRGGLKDSFEMEKFERVWNWKRVMLLECDCGIESECDDERRRSRLMKGSRRVYLYNIFPVCPSMRISLIDNQTSPTLHLGWFPWVPNRVVWLEESPARAQARSRASIEARE